MTITNKNDKRSQKGRSMVEMLGVLAIIGVLFVGGISAYSTAMEKHKANELMAATMQEAVLISAQLATGKTNPTLSGINNSLFTSASTVANSDNFKIALNAVDEDVCEKMKSMLGVSSMVHAISDNCGEMTFHKNLTPKAATQSGGNSGNSGDNSGEGGTAEPVDPCATVNCGEHGTCVDGTCECEDGWTGELCDEQEIKTCSDNSDCTKVNTFCLMTSETTGTCEALDSGTTVGNFLVHTEPMNYWSAQNWCEAHDKVITYITSSRQKGPFCFDDYAFSTDIFNELFGIKKAYAIAEPCIDPNTELLKLISTAWLWDSYYNKFRIASEINLTSADPSETAPVICVSK